MGLFGHREDSPWMIQLVGWMMLILGPCLLLVGTLMYLRERNFLATAVKTQGTIVELAERKGKNGTTYAPVFVFTDGSGTEHTIYSTSSSYPPKFEIGEKVTVYFDAAQPQNAQINSFFELWGLAVIFAAIGVGQIGLGAVFLYFGRK